jgi:hypothetical protein
MRATVVEFPHRQASAHYLASPSKAARPQVIRFPDPRDSLTTHDLDVLTELTSSAQTRWCLETMRDGDWNLSAFIASRWGTGNYAAFLVCRSGDTLRLIDARLSAYWQTLGVFQDVDNLARALCPLLDLGAAALQRS